MKIYKPILTLLTLVITVTILSVTLSFSEENKNEELIALNFVDVEITSIVKFISEITGNNFIFDERIKGRVTIITPTKLTIQESFNLFTSVLGLKGYTIIPSGINTYKIIQSSLAKQSGKINTDETIPINEGYITRLIHITNIKVQD